MNPLVVLGATGSIGLQAIDVAEGLGIDVVAVAAGTPSKALLDIAARHPEAQVGIAHPGSDEQLAAEAASTLGARLLTGPEAAPALAAHQGVTVVNGIVGSAGLAGTLSALLAGNRLALANKESLIAGGPVVLAALEQCEGELIPVDSEHSALWQCLVGEDPHAIERLVLTASGGPFRGRRRDQLSDVTVEEALAHPTWAMGGRITIDSATLMNKALEVIEAHHLFRVPYDRIDVTIHPQSIVHSMVEFADGSVKAQLGDPDMRVPIQYAITYPTRMKGRAGPFDPARQALTFEEPDRETFPALDLGFEAGRRGGSAPAVLNAADEVAVDAFLSGRIGFLDIAAVVARTLERMPWQELVSVEDVLLVDEEARSVAANLL